MFLCCYEFWTRCTELNNIVWRSTVFLKNMNEFSTYTLRSKEGELSDWGEGRGEEREREKNNMLGLL